MAPIIALSAAQGKRQITGAHFVDFGNVDSSFVIGAMRGILCCDYTHPRLEHSGGWCAQKPGSNE